ncbi:hypothetical protein WL94_23265 [Burkholderia cepacia]|uniref:hypothetical protein n=1 Tax=Burkholderia cepacia TaxID=292 RepID=UPI000756C98E|nr:hypothetical protein [Burkholderia cepacia]KWF83362.1 hypothetical protein WL94_23265 [Burkholderia cepacia]
MKTWQVFVHGYGYIGSVDEETEEAARCAALSKFAEEGARPTDGASGGIYENDEFDVRPA